MLGNDNLSDQNVVAQQIGDGYATNLMNSCIWKELILYRNILLSSPAKQQIKTGLYCLPMTQKVGWVNATINQQQCNQHRKGLEGCRGCFFPLLVQFLKLPEPEQTVIRSVQVIYRHNEDALKRKLILHTAE